MFRGNFRGGCFSEVVQRLESWLVPMVNKENAGVVVTGGIRKEVISVLSALHSELGQKTLTARVKDFRPSTEHASSSCGASCTILHPALPMGLSQAIARGRSPAVSQNGRDHGAAMTPGGRTPHLQYTPHLQRTPCEDLSTVLRLRRFGIAGTPNSGSTCDNESPGRRVRAMAALPSPVCGASATPSAAASRAPPPTPPACDMMVELREKAQARSARMLTTPVKLSPPRQQPAAWLPARGDTPMMSRLREILRNQQAAAATPSDVATPKAEAVDASVISTPNATSTDCQPVAVLPNSLYPPTPFVPPTPADQSSHGLLQSERARTSGRTLPLNGKGDSAGEEEVQLASCSCGLKDGMLRMLRRIEWVRVLEPATTHHAKAELAPPGSAVLVVAIPRA